MGNFVGLYLNKTIPYLPTIHAVQDNFLLWLEKTLITFAPWHHGDIITHL